MNETARVIIDVICALGGFAICYLSFFRTAKKDCEEEGKATGQMLSELGYIKANTDDIKAEQREQRKINNEFYTRMASVEASAKQAHKRIDKLEANKDE